MEKSTQPLSERADVYFDGGIFVYLFCSDNLRKGRWCLWRFFIVRLK